MGDQAEDYITERHSGMLHLLLLDQSYYRDLPKKQQESEAFSVLSKVLLAVKSAFRKPDKALTVKFGTYLYDCIKHECWKRGEEMTQALSGPKGSEENPKGQSPPIIAGASVAYYEEGYNPKVERIELAIERLGEPCRTILSMREHESQKIADCLNTEMPKDKGEWKDYEVRKERVKCRKRLQALLDNPKF